MFATIGGILLTISMELLLRIVGESKLNQWGTAQTIGTLLLLSSLFFMVLAFLLEEFRFFLVERGKEKAALNNRKLQFYEWPQCIKARVLFIFAIGNFFIVLIMLFRHKT